jgi:hypothetical protein
MHSIVQGIKDLAIHPIKNITQRSQGRRVEAGIARLSKKLIYESRQFKTENNIFTGCSAQDIKQHQ